MIMSERNRIIKILEELSERELKEVGDFAEFLLSKRRSGPEIAVKEGSKADDEIDYDDFDDMIR